MLFKILQYMQGFLRIRITGYSAERFLNACRYRGIHLWNMKPCGNAYEMNITIRGFRQIKPIVRKTGTKVVILQRIGFPFFLYRYRKRKIFFAGAGMFCLLLYFLSGMIWKIDIRGNLTRTDETILEFLDTKEIRNGMKRADVDCAGIVRDIRKEFDDIIWVSASIEGTKLMIQVKENRDSISASKEEKEEQKAVDIVSDVDGTITEIVTRRGIPLVEKGSQVKAGDILVSGQVPVNNDAGETVSYQYQEADADIKAQTSIFYKDDQELTCELKKYEKGKRWKYYVKFGEFRIGVGSTGNKQKNVERYNSEKQLELFRGFYLPIVVGKNRVIPYSKISKSYSEEEYQSILSERFERYCEDLQKKGVEIIGNDVKIYTGSEKAEAKGTLVVMKPIGKKKNADLITIPEQIQENEESGEE